MNYKAYINRSILTVFFSGLALAVSAQKEFNILRFGAKSGLSTNNTLAIQKAIDEAAKQGGKVIIPSGNFITGPLSLKSNVELHLVSDAVLLGSTQRLDYNKLMSLISAQGQQHISITGNGIIDAQGRELVENLLQLLREGKLEDKQWLMKRPVEENRPNIIFFQNCKDVKVTGITLKNAASWVQNYKECDGVLIDNMTVQSTAYWNNDGIDIVDSKNVKISNSYFNAADDAICLKSEKADKSCENVLVENCKVRSSANGFKIGTGSLGGFKNIMVKNLTVFDTYRSAVALETVDGANLENVMVSGVRAKNTGNAFFIRLGHRNIDNRYSTLKNVLIENLTVEVPSGKPDIGYPVEGPPPKVLPHNLIPSSIVGLSGHPVKDITLKNIEIVYGGGASKAKAYVSTDSLALVPENAAGYPEFTMFGELPGWGMYMRHAEGVLLENVKLSYRDADFRPALVADDVKDLSVIKLNIPASEAKQTIVLNNVTNPVLKELNLPSGETGAVLTQSK